MSVFDEPEPDAGGTQRPMVTLAVVGLLAVAAVVGWLAMRGAEEAPATADAPATAPRPTARPAAKKTEPAAAETRPAEAAPRREARPAETSAATPETASAATATTLTIDSDVPGASVFVDREFVGTAPVTLKDVAPGQKRVNVSAEGYEGVQRTVDVAAGENAVTLRFKEVRLNATVGVAHRHGMGGGCDGTLRATVDGLTYDTTNKNDAFTLPYAQVEAFEVNYLEKNLRVKRRGGRTWNFTDKTATNADTLFVFHRDVQAARDKLAKGYAAAR